MVQLLEHRFSGLFEVEDEAAARRSLRAQIARLERDLNDCFVTAYEQRKPEALAATIGRRSSAPRLLDLGELEELRDALADRIYGARAKIGERAEEQARNRLLLERMRAEPSRHKYRAVTLADLGQSGCGTYRVKPRRGIIGMMMGWWHVKLSSGCPLGVPVPAMWPAPAAPSHIRLGVHWLSAGRGGQLSVSMPSALKRLSTRTSTMVPLGRCSSIS